MRRVALIVVVMALAGCGSGDSSEGDLAVVATTTQLGDLARQVGGDRTAVHQILSPNADPHGYEPRPSDARELEGAGVVLRSGGAIDDWLGDLVESAGGGARAVTISNARGDPHWWQDPRRAQRAVVRIRDAFVEADPDGRATYGRNASRYLARLRALDADVASCLVKLPRDARKLVTTHDALGSYAARYGLEVIGAVIPSLSSQAQPSSKDVRGLVGQIRREKVKAIFPESSLSSKLERAVARESGATVGDELWADTLGPEGSSGETYIGSIEANTRAIAEGLSGGRLRCFGRPGSDRAASRRAPRPRS